MNAQNGMAVSKHKGSVQMTTAKIIVTYTSIDGCRDRRPYKSLAAARKFASLMVGEHPEMGGTYAVSGDGIGKVTVEGCALADLFPLLTETSYGSDLDEQQAYEEAEAAHEARMWDAQRRPFLPHPDGYDAELLPYGYPF